MESEESELLRKAGISLEEVARWLDVTKQAVTKGLEHRSYLTKRRIQVIFSHLLQERPAAAQAFRTELMANSELELPETLFDVVSVSALRDRTLDVGFMYRPRAKQEMWIVSPRPRELRADGYLERRSSELFVRGFRDYRRITSLHRIAYFCPPAVGKDLAVLFQRAFEDIPSTKRTDVKIVTSPTFQYTPDYTIFDPYQQGQEGWTMVEPGDLFVSMPPGQLSQITAALRVAGVSCWRPNLTSRQSYIDKAIEEQTAFEVLEWDSTEDKVRRVKRKKALHIPEVPADAAASPADTVWNPPIVVHGRSEANTAQSSLEFSLVFDSLNAEFWQSN